MGLVIGRVSSENTPIKREYLKDYIPIRWIQAQADSHPGMASAMWTRLINEWEKIDK